jgi:hypothetical protein
LDLYNVTINTALYFIIYKSINDLGSESILKEYSVISLFNIRMVFASVSDFIVMKEGQLLMVYSKVRFISEELYLGARIGFSG